MTQYQLGFMRGLQGLADPQYKSEDYVSGFISGKLRRMIIGNTLIRGTNNDYLHCEQQSQNQERLQGACN